MNDIMDCPDELVETCYQANGDPCTTGCDEFGNCIETTEEIENNEIIIMTVQEKLQFNKFITYGLTLEEQDWINDVENWISRNAIFNYLKLNTYSLVSKNFVKEAIKAFMEGGEVDFYNMLIYNPIIAQDYRASMSSAEEAIFDTLNTLQKEGYLRAATQAYIYAETHFPKPVRNRLGDAFKHAYWNALSTVYIGETLTEQLTTAHENIAYDPNYSNHFKETQMDLHNNNQGRQIAYGAGKIFQLIHQALDNGGLRYLNNLEFTTGFWRATDSSMLIPTNQ